HDRLLAVKRAISCPGHRATEVTATKARSQPPLTPVVRAGALGALVAVTSVARCALPTSRHKRPEQRTMCLTDLGVLGMLWVPLHAQDELSVRNLDRLHDPVRRADGSDSRRRSVIGNDGLMMAA